RFSGPLSSGSAISHGLDPGAVRRCAAPGGCSETGTPRGIAGSHVTVGRATATARRGQARLICPFRSNLISARPHSARLHPTRPHPGGPPMATVRLLTDDELSPEARAIFDDIRATNRTDYVNDFWRALAHDPATMRRTWHALKEVMGPGVLEPKVKEML